MKIQLKNIEVSYPEKIFMSEFFTPPYMNCEFLEVVVVKNLIIYIYMD